MVGQSAAALRLRETSIRDYDRPGSRFQNQTACWYKSTRSECEGVVLPVDEDTAIVKGVPGGAGLCSEHAFCWDEEEQLKALITPEDRDRFRNGLEFDAAERKLDLAHGQKLVDREDNKWGNG
jgi:hypothetical protein